MNNFYINSIKEYLYETEGDDLKQKAFKFVDALGEKQDALQEKYDTELDVYRKSPDKCDVNLLEQLNKAKVKVDNMLDALWELLETEL